MSPPTMRSSTGRIRGFLFDRDGTLVHDVPYNGDPERVRPIEGVREALDALRGTGARTAIVSNQSGVARGLISRRQLDDVNRRVVHLLGPFDAVLCCTHHELAGCACRKPRPGLVLEAARRLGLTPRECAVFGDIATDVRAAEAAGAIGVLVPTPQTRHDEVMAAPHCFSTLADALTWALAIGPAPLPARPRAADPPPPSPR